MLNEFDIPILKKSYDLYKTFNEYRKLIPKQDRFTVFEHCENKMLNLIEEIFRAGQTSKPTKVLILEDASISLNLLRIFIRLLKDIKSIEPKKYIILQANIDEIGRMLGGWIRSTKSE